jgi:hypothetical protein
MIADFAIPFDVTKLARVVGRFFTWARLTKDEITLSEVERIRL